MGKWEETTGGDIIVYDDPAVMRLDEKYFEQVRSGMKTTTIRTKVRRFPPRCRLVLRSVSTGAEIHAIVLGTRVCSFGEITALEARRDGFRSKKSLRQDLIGFYPDLTNETIMTVIEFQLVVARDDG